MSIFSDFFAKILSFFLEKMRFFSTRKIIKFYQFSRFLEVFDSQNVFGQMPSRLVNCIMILERLRLEMLTKKLKNVSFYQKPRGTFWSTFREKLSQSWRKMGPVFLPYDPYRYRPNRTVFHQKHTTFPLVWWSKNMEHFCMFYDFYTKRWFRLSLILSEHEDL